MNVERQHFLHNFIKSNLLFIQSIVSKGISHNLMKQGAKRRRTKLEIRMEKLEEERKKREIQERLERMDRLEA